MTPAERAEYADQLELAAGHVERAVDALSGQARRVAVSARNRLAKIMDRLDREAKANDRG